MFVILRIKHFGESSLRGISSFFWSIQLIVCRAISVKEILTTIIPCVRKQLLDLNRKGIFNFIHETLYGDSNILFFCFSQFLNKKSETNWITGTSCNIIECSWVCDSGDTWDRHALIDFICRQKKFSSNYMLIVKLSFRPSKNLYAVSDTDLYCEK